MKRGEDLPLLRELAKDQNSDVRTQAVKTLASFSLAEGLPLLRGLAKDLPLLRELAKDKDSLVRAEAMKALARLLAEDLPQLRELVKDQNFDVRTAAIKTLASFSRPEALPLLRELALAPDDEVAAAAVRGLALLVSSGELEAFLNHHDQKLCAGALAALDEVLYMPEWMKAKGTEQER